MCKAMNRSFISVILGGFGEDSTSTAVNKQIRLLNQEVNRWFLYNEKLGTCNNSTWIWNGSITSSAYSKEMADLLKKME